jgi:hypothetical protein
METKVFIEKDAESLEAVMNKWLGQIQLTCIHSVTQSCCALGVVVVVIYG